MAYDSVGQTLYGVGRGGKVVLQRAWEAGSYRLDPVVLSRLEKRVLACFLDQKVFRAGNYEVREDNAGGAPRTIFCVGQKRCLVLLRANLIQLV